MARRAFTLIELLVIVAIMATMVSVSVVSIRAGQSSARIKGATRNVMAAIRHARSMALVMMQPAIVTYSTTTVDDEVCAQVKVDGAKLTDSHKASDVVETLSGELIHRDGTEVKRNDRSAHGEEEEPVLAEGDGQTVMDVLFEPVSTEVVRGVRIKVAVGDELPQFEQEEEKKANKISVFSNVDYLLGKYRDQKQEEKKKAEEESASAPMPAKADEGQEPVSIVWEANGRCDPHRVWVYLDGSTPDKGLCIKVDRFGAAKVVSDDED